MRRHFADAPSAALLERLPKGEGGAAGCAVQKLHSAKAAAGLSAAYCCPRVSLQLLRQVARARNLAVGDTVILLTPLLQPY